jgi:hypothetical protein
MPKNSTPLLDRTYELLKDAEATPLGDIATGADVGIEWLKKLRAGDINDPSVNRIQRLHDFLAKRAAKPSQRQRA